MLASASHLKAENMGPAGSVGLTGQSGLAGALWTNETLASHRKWTTPLRMTHKVVPPTFANTHTHTIAPHKQIPPMNIHMHITHRDATVKIC